MTLDYDTIVVGAGLSGIGAAYMIRNNLPGKSFCILEGRESIGGTWDLFRYPGIRSDSEMYTLGYSFSPWLDRKMLADGDTILRYIKTTAVKYGISEHIKLGHAVKRVSWDDASNKWTVTIARTMKGCTENITMSCSFLFICTGYYDYDCGHAPQFKGSENFRGRIVHPQHWPENLDYTNKRVVVIGSGATAVTLVPAMCAAGAGHVTMLQRSPTYVAALPAEDPIALLMLKVLPTSAAHFLNRWKNIIVGQSFYFICKLIPKIVKKLVIWDITRYLGPEYEKHFTPKYDPWDQRFCVVPNGDLFQALRNKSASIVTDTIESFSETGIKVSHSSEEIPADIIVTATGLKLKLCGGMDIVVNGETKKDMTHNFMYKVSTYVVPHIHYILLMKPTFVKGVMVSGVPNFILAVGYTNATFTLKVDLISSYFCRMRKFMDKKKFSKCVPIYGSREGERADDTGEDLLDLSSGYIMRSKHLLPRQGKHYPWKYYQNYFCDMWAFRYGALNDGVMTFS